DAASGTPGKDRMALLKDALKSFANKLSNHDGEINVSIIGFGTHADSAVTFNGLTTTNQHGNKPTLAQLISQIDSLGMYNNQQVGGTNYQAAFQETLSWFNGQTSDYSDYDNLVYFLTDGEPTQY